MPSESPHSLYSVRLRGLVVLLPQLPSLPQLNLTALRCNSLPDCSLLALENFHVLHLSAVLFHGCIHDGASAVP
jgi:hypothetical protein